MAYESSLIMKTVSSFTAIIRELCYCIVYSFWCSYFTELQFKSSVTCFEEMA